MTNLQEVEVIINADFSENYTFQCTVHPIMCYSRLNGDIRKSSFIVISDHLQHKTSAFALFQLIEFLKATNGNLKRVYYFSDGSAVQHKNRYSVANPFFHEQDFGVAAEWQYFGTSHGKCACDGLGGSVKRTAWLHSLRNTDPKKNILSAHKLFQFSTEKSETVNFSYKSSQEVLEHSKTLERRFQTALPMEGIQSRHAIISSRRKFSVTLKTYSNAFTGEEKQISSTGSGIAFSDVRGIVVYANGMENKWQLGYVEDKNEATEDYEVTNLEPTVIKQSNAFSEAQQTLNLQDILLLVMLNPICSRKVRFISSLLRMKAADRWFRSRKDNQ
ncbi:hypothetical protein FOCC_FOCC014701 [Frankliniella occidentalis]|nr:hypothetical protein FOCC_FOCC014701 [Frankliniella occidentalis]